MAYELYQFNLGTGRAQAYVLHGTGEHEGTSETISHADMMAFTAGLDAVGLAAYLDNRFLRAHSDRLARTLAKDEERHG